MKKLWLVDVDGVVIDKDAMWQQLDVLFASKFPNVGVHFRSYYDAHKGELHSVDEAMKAMQDEYGVDETSFKALFDEVDYEACFDHEGWQRLQERAEREGFSMAFFTQGTEWVQRAKQRQLNQIVGELLWHIYEGDKVDSLKELITDYREKGIEVEGLVDDVAINRIRAEREGGLRTQERL